MKYRLVPIAAVIVMLLAIFSLVRTYPRWPASEPPAAPPRSEFTQRVAGVGLVEPTSENIAIASALPGVVERVWVQVGQRVQPGDPLVSIDKRALIASRAERQAELLARRAAVSNALARVERERAVLADARRTLGFADAIPDPRSLSEEERARRRGLVEVTSADVAVAVAAAATAAAAVPVAEAALETVQTELERSTVRAPLAARVLQVRIRPGEFVTAGPSPTPWLVLGDTSTLHVRADFDEHEAGRVRAGARATARIRGNATPVVPLEFVRFEPLVIPKQSLTGTTTERVDTRVLQVVYRVATTNLPLFVGQQMDVFVEAPETAAP